MIRYVKGDKVEVLNTTLEYSWHPARIVEGNEDAYTVMYDGRANGVVVEVVLKKYIRPCPPIVKFSNWSRGDLVHVFDNLAWKLATVLHVLEKKQFMVRVIGSMKDLNAGAAWIRLRHYWQGGQWIVVGKRPSISDVKRSFIHRNKISDSRGQQKNTNVREAGRSVRKKSHNISTRTIKRNPPSTLDLTEAWRKLAKRSRTIERSSPCTRNQTEACTGTGMRSKLTEELQGISWPPATNANLKQTHEKHEDSCLSSVGSCSINTNSSSHNYPTICAAHHCHEDVSDVESCIGSTPKPGKQTRHLKRPVQRCNLVIRIRQKNSLHRERHCRDSGHQASSSSHAR